MSHAQNRRWHTRGSAVVAVSLALATAVATSGAHAATKTRQVARVAVADFKAPDSARARSAILEILSEHDDVEVVALGDIVVAGKRLGADPTTPAGRARLSEELGIEAWLDGTIEDGSARFTLHGPDGRVLATASLQGHRAHVAEGLAGPKVWEAMGPILSVRERAKRAFQAQQDLAEKKVRAREQEVVRQRKVVQDRIAQRAAQLKAAQALARTKRGAFIAELDRQHELVATRTAADERSRKLAERQQTAAEEAEFMASLEQSSGPPPPAASAWGGAAASAGPEPSATNVWGGASAAAPAANAPASKSTNVWGGAATAAAPAASAPASKGTNVWGGASASATPPASSASNAPVAGSAPSGSPATPAVSPWALGANSGETAAASSSASGMPATSSRVMMAGTPSRGAAPRPAPAAAAAPAPNQEGLSASTRAWLEQQGSH